MNIQKSRQTAIMTCILSLLAVYASLAGVLNNHLYIDVLKAGTISALLVSGSLAQDMISIPLGLLLVLLSLVFLKRPAMKTFIIILGNTSYFFYGYGLYVISGQYTSIYLVYLIIFGLSIYSLIWGGLSLELAAVKYAWLPDALRLSIGMFLIVILLCLIPIWLLRMTPDIAKHIPGDTYAVFILDLCVVFPAFGLIATQLLQKKPVGNILAGVALCKVLTVCLSWAFGEWFVPFHGGFQMNYSMLAIPSTLTGVSGILMVFYLMKLTTNDERSTSFHTSERE